MPERILLSSIRTLTLYANKYTRARRTAPVPQLECNGSYCREFQPAAVQCINSGGSNVDIDWKCEADLPSSLRFGNLQVSCEGWDRPGDPYVLQGSCGLSYSLVRIRDSGESRTDYATYAFYIAFLLLALYLLVNWLLPRSYNRPNTHGATGSSWGGGGTGQGWGWGGRGGGPNSSNNAPPPPYTKYPSSNNDRSWTPGFWTGLGVGGLASGIWNRMNQPADPVYRTRPTWDWERSATGTGAYRPEASAARRRDWGHDDSSSWGAGSSTGPGTNLGEMRRATGYGGTSVR